MKPFTLCAVFLFSYRRFSLEPLVVRRNRIRQSVELAVHLHERGMQRGARVRRRRRVRHQLEVRALTLRYVSTTQRADLCLWCSFIL